MANNNFKRSNAAVNAEADAVCALLDNGYRRIYDGTQPATADTAITTQILLAELRFNATAYQSAIDGVATANAFTKDSDANATGTATWFRDFKSDGTTVVCDGSVGLSVGGGGTGDYDLNLAVVAIQQHAEVSITSYTYTANKG
jgi:hypothetical protein